MSAPEILLSDDAIRVTARAGTGRDLCVAFQSVRGVRYAPGAEEFGRFATDFGARHGLFVTDIGNSWSNAPGFLEAAAEAIAGYAGRIGVGRITYVGLSMGGFNAMAASGAAPAEARPAAVIAIAPQFTIDPARTPDRRWLRPARRIGEFAIPTLVGRLAEGVRYVAAHGLADADRLHHAAFNRRLPGVATVGFPDFVHPLARDLRRESLLVPFLKAAEAEDPAALPAFAKAAGARFHPGKWGCPHVDTS